MPRFRRDQAAPHQRARTLSSRRSKLLVIALVILVLILSYLSAVILIEGARNPETYPRSGESVTDTLE